MLDPQSLLLPPLRPPEPQLHPQQPQPAAAAALPLPPPPQQAGSLAARAAEAAMLAAGLTAEDLEGWDDWDEVAAAEGQPGGAAGPGNSLQDAAGSGGWGQAAVEVEWDEPGGIGSVGGQQQAWAAEVETQWDDEMAEGGASDTGYWASGQLLQMPAIGGSWQPGSEPPHTAVGEPAVSRAPLRGEQAPPGSPDPWKALSGVQDAVAADPVAPAHPLDVSGDPWAALAEGDGGGGGDGGSISSSPSMDVSQPEEDAASPGIVQLASAGAEGGWVAADPVQHALGGAAGGWWEGGDFEWGEQAGEEEQAGAQHSVDWQQRTRRSAPGSPDAAAWEHEGAAAASEQEWEWDYDDALCVDAGGASPSSAAAAPAAGPGRAPAPGGMAAQALAGGGLGSSLRQRHREIGAEIIRVRAGPGGKVCEEGGRQRGGGCATG